jgi:hypothetical protein
MVRFLACGLVQRIERTVNRHAGLEHRLVVNLPPRLQANQELVD